jgi:hypothetical protein
LAKFLGDAPCTFTLRSASLKLSSRLRNEKGKAGLRHLLATEYAHCVRIDAAGRYVYVPPATLV